MITAFGGARNGQIILFLYRPAQNCHAYLSLLANAVVHGMHPAADRDTENVVEKPLHCSYIVAVAVEDMDATVQY